MDNINKIDFSQYLSDEMCLKLVRSTWNNLSMTDKLQLAQVIINIFLEVTNIKIPVKASFTEFKDDGIRGIFDRDTNILGLNSHIFIENYRQFSENDIQNCIESNSYFYHVIMHELKHVEQAWLMQHPELNFSRAKKLNTNKTITKKNNMYIVEGNLYTIQISEREAFEFEEIQQAYLYKRMEKLVSSDIAFGEFEMFSYFLNDENDKMVKNIKLKYRTNTPEQDLDDIMDAIVNNKHYDNLNQTMLKEVLELTKIRKRFFPFFAQEQLLVEDNEKLLKTELDTTEEPELEYNDWFDDR